MRTRWTLSSKHGTRRLEFTSKLITHTLSLHTQELRSPFSEYADSEVQRFRHDFIGDVNAESRHDVGRFCWIRFSELRRIAVDLPEYEKKRAEYAEFLKFLEEKTGIKLGKDLIVSVGRLFNVLHINVSIKYSVKEIFIKFR